MRCPSCGTDNAPDSRFCGGCGARFASSGQRVAPTQKISDDARFPQQPAPGGPGAGAAVPVTAPGIVPARPAPATPFVPQAPPAPRPVAAAAPARPITAVPDAHPPSTASAASAGASPPGSARRPRPPIAIVDDPSLSLPIAARRPWGLIAVVLVIDLALAAGGVWMLREGLSDRPRRAAPARSGERAALPTEVRPS